MDESTNELNESMLGLVISLLGLVMNRYSVWICQHDDLVRRDMMRYDEIRDRHSIIIFLFLAVVVVVVVLFVFVFVVLFHPTSATIPTPTTPALSIYLSFEEEKGHMYVFMYVSMYT